MNYDVFPAPTYGTIPMLIPLFRTHNEMPKLGGGVVHR